MWQDFPARLCQTTGCPGLIYDRLGYGQSSTVSLDRSINYLHDYALIELPMVLSRILGDTPCILIGHSDGGSIALIYGAERSPLVKGIITEAAHVYVDNETIAGIELAQQAWEQGKLQGLRKYHGEKTEWVFKSWSKTWLSDWFRTWNITNILPQIRAPLLVIQGEDDQYGTAAQVETISCSSGNGGKRIVPNCGHIPHLEAGSVVLEHMSLFIENICSSNP